MNHIQLTYANEHFGPKVKLQIHIVLNGFIHSVEIITISQDEYGNVIVATGDHYDIGERTRAMLETSH